VQVYVRDNDVNAAIRVLKTKMQLEGTFREMKSRRSDECAKGPRRSADTARRCASGSSARVTDRGFGGKLRQAAEFKKGARPMHKLAREGRVSTGCKSPGV
jgi:small subunit ribosomal protein S21